MTDEGRRHSLRPSFCFALGGGLFDLNGELVGIVNSKSSGSDVEGLAFAIPANTVQEITQELIQYGYVRRPQMGISVAQLTRFAAGWQANYHRRIQQILRDGLSQCAPGEPGKFSADQVEAFCLYGEYAIDFAIQTARHALVAILTAVDI